MLGGDERYPPTGVGGLENHRKIKLGNVKSLSRFTPSDPKVASLPGLSEVDSGSWAHHI